MVIISRWMRWEGNEAHTGEIKNAYKVLVGKLEGRNYSEYLRCKWEDSIL
jgi:hypothetical protein